MRLARYDRTRVAVTVTLNWRTLEYHQSAALRTSAPQLWLISAGLYHFFVGLSHDWGQYCGARFRQATDDRSTYHRVFGIAVQLFLVGSAAYHGAKG